MNMNFTTLSKGSFPASESAIYLPDKGVIVPVNLEACIHRTREFGESLSLQLKDACKKFFLDRNNSAYALVQDIMEDLPNPDNNHWRTIGDISYDVATINKGIDLCQKLNSKRLRGSDHQRERYHIKQELIKISQGLYEIINGYNITK
jgi:hypothetical protein